MAWSQERTHAEELAIPTTGFIVHFCRRPNPSKDGAFPQATENEAFQEVPCEASQTTVVIDKFAYGTPLSDDCDYEVRLSLETVVGRSEWSKPVVGRTPHAARRTPKLPSVASKMMEFYRTNKAQLPVAQQGVTPWEMSQSGGKKTLFLGLTSHGPSRASLH